MPATDEDPSNSIVSELVAFAMPSEPKCGLNTKVSLPGPPTVTEAVWVPVTLVPFCCVMGGSTINVPPSPSPEIENVEFS